MSKLKFWTTVLLFFGFGMLFGYPFLLNHRPGEDAARADRARFAMILTSYMVVLLIIFFVLIVLAWRIVVRNREAYRDATLTNLRDLVEGTLNDHGRKREDDPN